jgi:hypothetical protein
MAASEYTDVPIFGVFPNRYLAEAAIADLKRAGFLNEQIGMIYRNSGGDTVRTGSENANRAAEGAAVGAGAGALGGALIGLGVWTGAIPIIGPVFAVGAVGTVLLNAVAGAAVTSLAGALIGWGISEDDAGFYEDEVKAGRVLVTVHASGREQVARDVLSRHEGYNRATVPLVSTTVDLSR